MTNNQLIGPDVWGKYLWHTIHYVALGYPEKPTAEDKERYKAFYLLFQHILPCKLCSDHYKENLKKVPLSDDIMSDKEKLVRWTIDLHNVVNEMKEKPQIEPEIAKLYILNNSKCNHKTKSIEKFTNDKPKENNMTVIYGLLGLLGTLILIALVYKKN